MARITVEDCLAKIDSQYDLVLLAKERTAQLNAGNEPLVEKENEQTRFRDQILNKHGEDDAAHTLYTRTPSFFLSFLFI